MKNIRLPPTPHRVVMPDGTETWMSALAYRTYMQRTRDAAVEQIKSAPARIRSTADLQRLIDQFYADQNTTTN
jgi:hypothetical protein